MHTCEFCGSPIPDNASFCGNCGRVPSKSMETGTMASDFQIQEVQNIDTATIDNVSGNFQSNSVYNQQSFISNTPTTLLSQEEEEEEKRRRAALLGLGAPLLGDLAVEGMPDAGNVPMVQGTPQFGGVPTVQGTPYPPADSMGPGFYASPTVMAPPLPNSIPVSPMPATTVTLHHPQQPHPAPNKPHGCSLVFIVAAIMIPVLIILTFIGLGLTLFAPSLSLSGSTTIVQGGTFTLHGSHFIPGSSVTLTLDDSIPLYFSSRGSPVQSAQAAKISMGMLTLDMQQERQQAFSSNTVSVGGDGTFSVTITANPGWVIGEHTITAAESPTHRSASIVFTINPAGTTPTPITNSSTTPSPSPSPSPTTTLTPTATATLPGLSCVNPSTLSLGPVIQGYTQPVSAQITLCTTGTGTVNWTATWDQNAAPWLHLDHTSGQITAPGQVQVTASALASNLAPGSYPVTLTFTGQPDNSTESLQITFTVQGGCVSGNPNTLNFSGVANVSDPTPQTVTLTNCGPTGAWSAAAQTNDGGNWLYASPTSGTLNAGTSSNITITASNLITQLTAGTYTGNVTFKIGTGTFNIQVTLTVMPTLSARPISIYANQQCKINPTGGLWLCTVVLIDNSNTVSLSWYATSSVNNIKVNPSKGTLQPGHPSSVLFSIPQSDCSPKGNGTITFTGPGNAVTVSWNCIVG